MAPSGNTRSQNRRTSPGKIATPPHIPPNFTSVRFTGYQDSLWYACSSSSPQPFSWFAVRYVHGFCLMLPPDIHFWSCPCPVGVVLPSGNGGLLLLRCLRHAGRTLESPLSRNFDPILSKIQGYDNENVSSQERFSHLTTRRKKDKLIK